MKRSIAPPRQGELVGGRYEVLGLIGRGGQSSVFRARDTRAGDEVALKVLRADFAHDSDFRERMFREAQAMASLQGTAAIRVLDQAWTDDGALCLVTELLHGADLETHLGAIEARGERASPALVRELLDPIVITLEAAHSQGIVHRDLKPANIHVLDPDHGGGTRLLDFGFAKFVRARSFTAHGMIAGSPSYIAPEAWDGRSDQLDQRADVYGLGAVIFRCLAGRPPFISDNLADLMMLVKTAARPSLHALRPELPDALDAWVEHALAADPEQRFMTVRALWRPFRAIT
jgi:serine/threonine-protein kinase